MQLLVFINATLSEQKLHSKGPRKPTGALSVICFLFLTVLIVDPVDWEGKSLEEDVVKNEVLFFFQIRERHWTF